ncbi:MAG: sensor domain-containing diguanylate cyclase [Burkholderiales bacterium]|nr:sensor domain-containing diguanylate cyclase [Burkholderiales bacterium]
MRFRGLQFRMMVAMLAAAALFAAVAGLVSYRLGYQRALAGGRATLDGLLSAVEKTAAIGAYTSDKILLQEVIDGLGSHDLIASVEVRSPQGAIIVSRQATKTSGADTDPGIRQIVARRLASPFDKNEAVGEVRIEADMARLQASAWAEAGELFLVMAGQTALLAIVLYVMAARLVSRPIVRLADRLRRMRPGSDDRLITPAGHYNDEIGALVEGANVLLQTNRDALHNERELRAEIEKMEAQYRQIFDASSAGIFVLDRDGRLVNCNPTVLRVLGLQLSDMKALRGDDFVHKVFARPDRVMNLIDESARLAETMADDLELRQVGEASRWVHCLISVQFPTSAKRSIEGVMYDITERKRAEVETQRQAEYDALTGLRNRRATDDVIDRFITAAAPAMNPISVLYIDLDGFKQVNDQLGHKAGDQVLVHCAQRLRHVLRRTSDVVGRIGGDEFVAVLNGVGPDDEVLGQIAQAMLSALAEPIVLEDGQVARVAGSIGVACFPVHGTNRKSLLHAADEAMYEVKHSGKNCFAMASGLA